MIGWLVLRRKLLINFGPLVLLLLISAVLAIWLLEGVLQRVDGLSFPSGDASRDAAAVAVSFRRIVMGLAIVFLIVINLSVILLLRMGYMILRPVDRLIQATRALAEGRFDYRVRIEQHDEFDELARAYNDLAERLQSDERRQLETLGQVALAMNHEINNAISIIELQLRLLTRQSPTGAAPERYLHEIHQSLQRMTHVVAALRSVRRIVLTDYLPGIKMLDLERSQHPACEQQQMSSEPGRS
jgi:methyl-accepting chemotaxis protein